MKRHWLSGERAALYSAGLFALYLFFGLWLVIQAPSGVTSQGDAINSDFLVFWSASHIGLSEDPVNAYDYREIVRVEHEVLPGATDTKNPWHYPPTFYLLILPLSLLPYFTSYWLFVAVTFAGCAWTLRKTLAAQGLATPGSWFLLLGFPPVLLNAYEGQNGFLTVALMGGALLLLSTRPLCAGVLIGLLTIKPQLGLLLPLALICGRHWRALLAAAVTAVTFLGLSLAVLGLSTLTAFLSKMPIIAEWLSRDTLPLVRKMPTLFAFGRLIGLPSGQAMLLQAVVALAVAVATAWVWLRCRDMALRYAALTSGTLLVSPYLFDYDQIWLALPLIWFAGHTVRRGWLPWERELLALAWLSPLVTTPLANHTGFQGGAFVVLGLFLAVLRRAAQDGTERMQGPIPADPALPHSASP